MKRLSKNIHIFLPISFFVLLITIWEVSCNSITHLQFVLPPPTKILACIYTKPSLFALHTLATLQEMSGGFLLAFFVAFPLGWMMAASKTIRYTLQPIFLIIQCVPMFTLAPIMVLWFGWSYTAVLVPTAMMIFFPLTMNIYQGLCSTPQHLIDYFQINGATTWQLFSKLQLPWALPQIFTGFRISTAIAAIGAVAGEWAGAQQGLGILMLESRRATDLDITFAALLSLTALSCSLYGTTVLIENYVIRTRKLPYNKKLTSLFAVFLLFLFMTPFYSMKTQATTTLTLDWLPNPNHVPIYVGIDKGFFEEYGINLNVVKVQDPSDPLAYLTSGQTDLTVYYMTDTIRAQRHGAPLVPVGVLIEQPLNSFIYKTNDSIRIPEDLNNKVIGYSLDGTSRLFLEEIFAMNGITPNSYRNVSFDLVGTLGTNRVDVITHAYWNIEKEHLRSLGVETEHITYQEMGVPNYYELIFLIKKGGALNNPTSTMAFQKGIQKSIDYSVTHPDEAFQLYLARNPNKTEKTAKWEREAWDKTIPLLAKKQEVDKKVWESYIYWLDEHKLL